MSERGPWPRRELVSLGGPNMPLAERVTRYRANVMAIHEGGHAVPSAMADTLDAVEIEAWIRRSDATSTRLAHIIRRIGDLPDDTTVPSPLG
jgi:hypothetical protein